MNSRANTKGMEKVLSVTQLRGHFVGRGETTFSDSDGPVCE